MSRSEYDDIINLPHPVSQNHPSMPVPDRAAQFAPFAALTGYDAAVRETARHTDEKSGLDEDVKEKLDKKLRYLIDNAVSNPVAVFTYFVPDGKKSGGAYVSRSGTLKKIDTFEQKIALRDGTVFPIDNLYSIDLNKV